MIPTTSARDGDWIAVHVRTGCEKIVSVRLRDRGYEEFLPMAQDLTACTRKATVQRALFPGYVFCRYAETHEYPIVRIPAVIRLVGESRGPLSISEAEVQNLRRVVDSGIYSEPWKFVEIGHEVIVKRGVLQGMRGILVEARKRSRLVINIELLGRGVAVEMPAWNVAAAENSYLT